MASFQIVCVNKSAPRYTGGHGHIEMVGVGDSTGWAQRLTVLDVYRLMNAGNRFHTVSPSTGKLASVVPYTCCGIHTLRSGADAVTDNNLDNLVACRVA